MDELSRFRALVHDLTGIDLAATKAERLLQQRRDQLAIAAPLVRDLDDDDRQPGHTEVLAQWAEKDG